MPKAEAKAKEERAADQLEVLFPDRQVKVRDPDTGDEVTLEVREFRFREGLEVQVEARALIAALAALVSEDRTDVGPVEIGATLGAHPDLWIALIARATDREADWIGRLDDRAARDLTALMWAVNAPFFCCRATEAALGTRDLASLYLSAASSMRSSRRDTAAPTDTGEPPTASPGARSSSSGSAPKSGARKRSRPPGSAAH